ncbi:MAG: hypothetical protein E7040_10655 [Lentisphaerae bacterium]|nr:hypothetical protein [Lentisphaerota bacterium]
MKNLLFAAFELVNRWKEESELESGEARLYAAQIEAVERAVLNAGGKDAKSKSQSNHERYFSEKLETSS